MVGGGLGYTNEEPWSGWYSTEDLRLPDAATAIGDEITEGSLRFDTTKALQDAARAASAADAELLVFFETSSNTDMINDRFSFGSDTGPATGNGDIWIHTDFAVNPDGSAKGAQTGKLSGVSLFGGPLQKRNYP